MKKIVITGGTGYIGSHLTQYMLREGWEVYVISQSKTWIRDKAHFKGVTFFEYNQNIDDLILFFNQVEPDAVFHLASAVINNYSPSDIPNLIQSNIQFGTEVLEAMRQCSTRLFINTCTYWQYYLSSSYNPVDLYAATKEAFEQVISYYSNVHHIRSISLYLYDVYGENDLRPKLMNMLKKAVLNKIPLDLSPGEQLLDLIHVSDVCSAYLAAYDYLIVNSSCQQERYAVATNRQISIKNLVRKFEEVCNTRLDIRYGVREYKLREVMIPYSGLPLLPNWEHKINIREGIQLLFNDD